VATWWLIGDRSTVPASADPDYAFRPFDVGPAVERTAGTGATVLAAITLLVLVWATRSHHLDSRWWKVFLALLAAGIIAGFGWRVMTAGVIGANIGAGLVVFFGGPVVAALLVWAVAYSIYLARK
jgi:hypothetical protein